MGAGKQVVFAVVLGTGCGGGVAIGGEVQVGINGLAGEWGHNPLPWQRPEEYPGQPCYCGQRGCIESWISGTGLERDYKESSRASHSGAEIVRLFSEGDQNARAAMARYKDRLARALASVVNLLDPDVIVLGGGLSQVRQLYGDVPSIIGNYVFGKVAVTPVCPGASTGDSSGVRGAARLWPLGEDFLWEVEGTGSMNEPLTPASVPYPYTEWGQLVVRAHQRIPLLHPLHSCREKFPSSFRQARARIYAKLENVQETGSFKLRGATNRILRLTAEEKARGIIAASNGNHGLGVAAAAKSAVVSAEVYVSSQVASAKAKRIEEYGAEFQGGLRSTGCRIGCSSAAIESGQVFISPYNDWDVLAGQGSIAVELWNRFLDLMRFSLQSEEED